VSEPLDAAFAAIDAANNEDPVHIEWKGASVPKARLQGERATYWLGELTDDPTPAVQLASRAHHLRRFAIPRATFPDGRVGYRRWRNAQKAAVADALADVLTPAGIDTVTVNRTIELAQRTDLGTDPETQLVEDVACLVFCETDLLELLERLGPEKTADAVRKTLPKMSAAAIALAPRATPEGEALDVLLAVANG